jgi:hypothetical protein
VEASTPQPVAVAEIPLDEEERKRIARDLGLDESQLDAIPKKLDIHRYADDDVGDDVSGFLFNALQPQIQTGPSPISSAPGGLNVGKIPGGLLIPV